MKARAKVLLPLILLLVLPVVVQAQFTFTTNNGAITITGYTGSGGAVTIPDTTNGYPVISIGYRAFFECSGLTSVTIPDNSVTSIGNYAFYGCYSLTNFTIGNGVTNIGAEALSACGNLTSVAIPESATSIGDGAFSACRSLTAIMVDTNNPVYSSLDGVLLDKSQTNLIAYPGGKSAIYTIPTSVTSIRYFAFAWSGVTSVTIGGGVASIGDGAFDNCHNLMQLLFLGNAPTAGSLFYYQDIYPIVYYLPGTTGWSNTFSEHRTSLWSQIVPCGYTTNNGTITVTKYLGSGGAVLIPNMIDGMSVASIGDSAFALCTSLTSVTIPNSVTTIGSGAFSYCYNLASITIPSSVTNIGVSVFDTCRSLTNVTLPSSVTSIEFCAFCDCISLKSIIIPSSVTEIGSWAFVGCSSLTGVYFDGNAPFVLGGDMFGGGSPNIYCLPGTSGWGDFTANNGLPTSLWFLPNPLILHNSLSNGKQTNGLSFTIFWATNGAVVVEACTNLVDPSWSAVSTNILSNGTNYFSDPDWTNYPSSFYRIRSP